MLVIPYKLSPLYLALPAPKPWKMHDHKKDTEIIRTDSLLRETSSHYIRLIGDADRKARIMIVVNSILLTISVTLLTRSINHNPDVWISAVVLILANLFTLFFAVVSVKPELHSRHEKGMENNILNYKKCTEYTLEDYTARMLVTMQDNDKKIEAVIKDLYFYGNLLNMKYRLIKLSYRSFYWGIVLSVVSYIIILWINRSEQWALVRGE